MYQEQRTNQKLGINKPIRIRNQQTDQKLGIIKPIRIRNQQISRESERNCIRQICTENTYTKKRKKEKIGTLLKNEDTSGKIHENYTRYPEKNEKRATREYIRK